MGDPREAAVVATRAALRVLPLTSYQGIWTPAAAAALHQVFRVVALSWSDLAYPLDDEEGWTEDRENALRRLWNSGFTASEIGKALRKNRNSVVGKAHRLGLESRPENARLAIESHKETLSYLDGEAAQSAANAGLGTFPMAIVAGSGPSEVTERRAEIVLGEARHAMDVQGSAELTAPFDAAVDRDRENLARGIECHDLIQRPLWSGTNPIPAPSLPASGDNIWAFWTAWYSARVAGRTTDNLPYPIARGLDLRISAIDRNLWAPDLGIIAAEISKLRAGAVIEARHWGEMLSEPDPQSMAGVRFQSEGDGPIDVADSLPTQQDRDAQDRHASVRESADRLIEEFSPTGPGANQAAPIVRDVHSLLQALGEMPSQCRVGLLIPRGERLRQTVQDLDRPGDFDDEPSLSAAFARNLKLLVSSYNLYINADPNLEARDRAQVSPPLIDREISPRIIAEAVSDAVKEGVAEPVVQTVLHEEALIAPALPNPDNRSSRRYTESFRNFCRAAARRASGAIRYAWRNKTAIGAAAGAAAAAARWIVTHEALLFRVFPAGSRMGELISQIVDAVKTMS